MPGKYSTSGYDAAEVLLSAIAGGVPNQLPPLQGAGAAELRKTVLANIAKTNQQGVTNPISFAVNGDLVQGSIGIEQLASVSGAPGWKQVANTGVQ